MPYAESSAGTSRAAPAGPGPGPDPVGGSVGVLDDRGAPAPPGTVPPGTPAGADLSPGIRATDPVAGPPSTGQRPRTGATGASTTGAMVEVAGLRKSFGDRTVLDGVDFTVAEGTVVALLGPNGAGKTTTVRVLATLLRPDGGSARIGGHDVAGDPGAVRSMISLTGQYAAVDGRQTGRENLMMVGRLRHLGRRGARRRADELLERFGLAGAAGTWADNYSGGMRRRLDLAMGLVVTPRVMFLDEPTTGLDPTSRATTWDVVAGLVGDGVTVLLTTQYLEEADRLADRVVLVDGGRVVADGRAEELKDRVGGRRLDLRCATPAAAAAAARALDRLGGRPAADGLTVGVPSDGSAADVGRALDALATAGVDPHAVTVAQHEPTLDDVFVALTGTGAR